MQAPPATPPPVLRWYRIYCIFMAILYGILILASTVALVLSQRLLPYATMPSWLFYMEILIMFGLSVILMTGYILALYFEIRPWTWVYHLVMIAIGLTSPACLPASIPLLIFWIREDTRVYFGRK